MSEAKSNGGRAAAEERRMRLQLRKSVYVLPSLVTLANVFCGFYSVMESLLGVQAMSLGNGAEATDHFNRAAINIGFATLFDFLDGTIARMTKATSEFGIELDSLADVLSFGIAPAVLAYSWGYGQVPGMHKLGWAASFFFLICGTLRLARFNVLARSPKPTLVPKNPKVDKKAFVGMPIPAGASLVAAIVHFTPQPYVQKFALDFSLLGRRFAFDGQGIALIQIALMASLGLLMVSTIRYQSFKNVSTVKFHPRVLILLLTLLVLCVWFYSQWTLLVLATGYTTHGLISRLWSLVRHRRTPPDHSEYDVSSKTPG